MKTVWIVLISFVATAAIVGGGTYYYVNHKAANDKNALQSQINDLNEKIKHTGKSLTDAQTTDATQANTNNTSDSNSTTSATTPIATVSTADWKTFSDKTYGFSFKYPAADVANSDTSDSDSNIYIRANDGYWLYTVTVTPNTANQTLAQVAKQNFDNLSTSITAYMKSESGAVPTFIKSDLNIGGILAKKMTTSTAIGYSPSAEVVMIKNNSIITISPRAESDEFNTVLSTFQFIDNTATNNIFSATNLNSATVSVGGIDYTLANGTYTHPGDGPFNPEVPGTITFDQNHIVVDSANANQAAIILQMGGMRHGGSSVTPAALEIMTNNSNTPKYFASVILNNYYKTVIDSLTFASNIVTIKMTGPENTKQTVSYKLSGNSLIKQ